MDVSGVLNLDKPRGVTSRRVVDQVVRLLPRRTKAGHAGTLDPIASGVLVVCVGAATRLIASVQSLPKRYRATVRLGARSNTLDDDGQVEVVSDPTIPTEEAVRQALAAQVGEIRQLPPEFSALRLRGERAYDLARRGQTVKLEPRIVRIDRIELLEYHWPRVDLEVECGGGTYIRSIARDLGEALGCGGLIEVLVRTRIGHFHLEDARDPEGLTPGELHARLRPARDAVAHLHAITLTEAQAAAVRQGRRLDARELVEASDRSGDVALLGPDGRLVAVAQADASLGVIQPRTVLP